MAGLAGLVDVLGTSEQLAAVLDCMLRCLQAEPWYSVSGRVLANVALGRASLGIFNPGAQPVSDQSGTVWALLDGVLYDCPAVRGGSQAQRILQLYQAHGDRFVRDLDGTFNLVIWDAPAQKLMIANDRFGSRPFYYSRPHGGLSFASEIKALLEVPGTQRAVNHEAVIEFFTLRHHLGDKTPFAGIYWLPPASLLTYQSGRLARQTYWEPPFDSDGRKSKHGSLEVYAAELNQLLRRAVGRSLGSAAPAGVMLSGGLDSRLLVSAAAPGQVLHTFTRSVPGSDDARLGQQVAAAAGTIHHFLEIKPDFLMHQARRGVWLTDGLMSCVDFYELSTIDQVRPHANLVAFGIDAACLGGLGISPALRGLGDEALADQIYAARAVVIPDALQSQLLSASFYQQVAGLARHNLRQTLRALPSMPSQVKAQIYFMNQYNTRSALHGPVLTRSLVETCLPMADAELLQLVCQVPPEMRFARRMQIQMLRQASPALAAVTWQYSGLPARDSTPRRVRVQRALYRGRRELNWHTRGLIPAPRHREQTDWPNWFRTMLRPWLKELLLGERTLARGYYNPRGLRALFDEHMAGTHDHTLQFGPLLTFELWHRIFLEGEAP